MGQYLLRFAFILFSFSAAGQNADYKILQEIHGNRNRDFDRLFLRFSQSADFIAPAYPVFLAAEGFLHSDSSLKIKALQAGAGLGLSAALAWGLKYSVRRKRPFDDHPEINPPFGPSSSWSFPSGTASIAFETATAMSLQFPGWKVWLPAYLWAGTVAYSRIRSGEHYPGDVLAGAAIGLACAWVSHKAKKWLVNRHLQRGLHGRKK
jgi:undecaprenyl-diphosphatase